MITRVASRQMSFLNITSCVRGYHVYRDRWTPTLNEDLTCLRERGNIEDPHAVAVLKYDIVVGHVPRRISTMCSMFLGRRGTITCTITGAKRYSADLAQGGMEVPCTLTFAGEENYVKNIRRLLPTDIIPLEGVNDSSKVSYEKEAKKLKVDVDADKLTTCSTTVPAENGLWVSCGNYSLSINDKNSLTQGNNLSDKHINFAQNLIKEHHPTHHWWTEIYSNNNKTQLSLPRYREQWSFSSSDSQSR